MALVYVGGTSGVGTTATYAVSLSGTLTGGIASSPSEGDIVVVFSGFGNTAAVAPTCTGNNSGAYAFVTGTTSYHQNDTWDAEFAGLFAIQGATVDTSLTIGRTANGAYGGATAIQVWRGVDTTTPFDVATTVSGAGNTSLINPIAITPTTAGAVILAGGTGTQTTAGSAFVVSSNMTGPSVTTFGNGTTSDTGTCIASHTWTSGAFDPNVVTGGTTSTSSAWRSMTLALRPFVAVNHAATGALTGQGSTVAGTAVHKALHTSTGALTGDGSVVVGSAVHQDAHQSTGALVGAGSVIAGTAARTAGTVTHDGTGALSGVASTIAGTAARTRVHSATGVLVGAGSLIVVSAARFRAFASSGVLTGQGSTAAGSAARSGAVVSHAATGVLVGAGSVIAGASARVSAPVNHAASGALSGSGAVLAGSANRIGVAVSHDATGSLVGVGAALDGAAINGTTQEGDGAGGSRRTKWYVKHKKKILVFDAPEHADSYIESLKEQKPKRAITPPVQAKFEPIETIRIAPLAEQVKAFSLPFDIDQLIQQQNLMEVARINLIVRELQDEEDIELLLIA